MRSVLSVYYLTCTFIVYIQSDTGGPEGCVAVTL